MKRCKLDHWHFFLNIILTAVFLFLLTVSPDNVGAATFIVTNIEDSGPGSLRDALVTANSDPDLTTIKVSISGPGPHTIQPLSPLPIITESVIIDATEQPGFSGQPIIELDGSNAGGNTNGLDIRADNCIVKGLVINRFFGNGIFISTPDAHDNKIEGNFIGTDIAGTGAEGNGVGIGITAGATNNIVGGTTPEGRNVISGNLQKGVAIVHIGTDGNQIVGNYIGTDLTGAQKLGNGAAGIQVVNASSGNIIGGLVANAGNIISNNGTNGIELFGCLSAEVYGNRIGTDVTGAIAFGNTFHGIIIHGGSDNIIGAVGPGRNIISGNTLSGIRIATSNATGNQVSGNYIGTKANGLARLANGGAGVIIFEGMNNTIGPANVISGNTGQGIHITGDAGGVGTFVLGNFVGTNAIGDEAISNNSQGIYIGNSPNNTIGGTTQAARNIISGNENHGIALQYAAATNNHILGNYIGTNESGDESISNINAGIAIFNGASSNKVGGTETDASNTISGNTGSGISIAGDNSSLNTVQGNRIGTNAAGLLALPNSDHGIFVMSANNTIGGTVPKARNVISGNGNVGVYLYQPGATNNHIEGNYIGTDITSNIAIANNTGVLINQGASNNFIGGDNVAARNLIFGNTGSGVNIQGSASTGNLVFSNSIFENGGLGIDLQSGANNLQSAPVLTDVESSGGIINGTLNSISGTAFTIQFFSNTVIDLSNYGEGETFLGSESVTTNESGFTDISHTLSSQLPVGQFVTATATDPNNNTSEFSHALVAFDRLDFENLSSQTLEGLISRINTYTPDKFSGKFVVPTEDDRAAMRDVVQQMLEHEGDCTNIDIPVELKNTYEIVTFQDEEPGFEKSYCVLREIADIDGVLFDGKRKVDFGWGTFIVNHDANAKELNIQIPHPKHDSGTRAQGITVFKKTNARSYLLAGTHRHANLKCSECQHEGILSPSIDHRCLEGEVVEQPPDANGDEKPDWSWKYLESDVAHNENNLFHAASEQLFAFYQANGKDYHVIQFHGMGSNDCPDVDVYLTYGSSTIECEQGDKLRELKANLRGFDLEEDHLIAVPGDTPPCNLHGTLNVQGRLFNGVDAVSVCATPASGYSKRFMHIEQKKAYREKTDYWVNAIEATFKKSFIDSDSDGIADEVEGGPGFDFSDVGIGGTTYGVINNPGDQKLTIVDSQIDNGILIMACTSFGAGVAEVKMCDDDESTFTIPDDGRDHVFTITCGSVLTQVISGEIEITLVADDGTVATVNLSEGNGLTFEPETAALTVPETNLGDVVVKVDGREISLEPGDETDVTLPPLPHPFVLLADKSVLVDGQYSSEGPVHSNDKITFKKGNPSTHSGNLTAAGDIKIEKDIMIEGDVLAGGKLDLKKGATVSGEKKSNANIAVEILPVLDFNSSGDNVTVKKDEPKSLEPGSYGDVKVNAGGTLQLRHDGLGGEYFFKKLDLMENTDLLIDAVNGAVTVNVVKQLNFYKMSSVKITHLFPDNGSRFVTFNSLADVIVHKDALVLGSINAPGKKVHVHKNVIFQGAICANEININKDVLFFHHESKNVSFLEKVSDWYAQMTKYENQQLELAELPLPTKFGLSQNFPNPFNPTTTMEYAVPKAGNVQISIIDMLGRHIRTLVNTTRQAGLYQTSWDGLDDNNISVAAGVYFYKMQAGDFVTVKRLVLIR
jgi:hypothetical protein